MISDKIISDNGNIYLAHVRDQGIRLQNIPFHTTQIPPESSRKGNLLVGDWVYYKAHL